jgi:hypothetical protein
MYSISIPGLKFTTKKKINHSVEEGTFLYFVIGGDLNKYEFITKK